MSIAEYPIHNLVVFTADDRRLDEELEYLGVSRPRPTRDDVFAAPASSRCLGEIEQNRDELEMFQSNCFSLWKPSPLHRLCDCSTVPASGARTACWLSFMRVAQVIIKDWNNYRQRVVLTQTLVDPKDLAFGNW